MGDWWAWPLTVAVVGALLTGGYAMLNRHGSERSAARMLKPPTWPEMWSHMQAQDARIDALEERAENRDRAITNILHALANQWPVGAPPPVFDPADLDVLGDTMPSQWVRHNNPRKKR